MFVVGWLILLVATPALLGQGSAEDYARSTSFGARTSGGVLNESVTPQWIAGTGSFWYRRQTGRSTFQYILVHADRGTRTPAFDHDGVAKSLSAALGRTISADRLPLDDLTFDAVAGPGSFNADGRRFTLDPVTAKVQPAGGERPVVPVVIRPSKASDVETSITFVNESQGPVELFWVDTTGRRRSYGTLPRGQSREQHTFADHSWVAVDAAGKALAAFIAKEGGSQAVITGAAGDAPREPERPAADRPAGERQRRDGESRRRSPTGNTSPDRRYRVEVREHNLFLRDLNAERETQLTTDGTEQDGYAGPFHWSPDSSRLMVMQTLRPARRKISIVESSPRDQVQPKLVTLDYVKPGDEIDRPRPRLFDVAAGRRIEVTDTLFDNPWRLSDPRWSADSSRFTFLYNQRGHQVLRTVAVSRDGKATTLFEDTSKTFIDYSSKFYCRWINDDEGFGQVVWMSERSGWNHLYLIDGKTGEVINPITAGPWLVRDVERIDVKKRQIWFKAMGLKPEQDPYYPHLCRVNFDGTGFIVLTEGDGAHRWQFSPDGRYLLDTFSRVDQPPVTTLRDADTGAKVSDVETADASALLKSGYTVPRRFSAKGRDGKTDIHGIIVLPSNFDPAKKYPVVEQIYAGPQSSFTPKEWGRQRMHHQIAELGFIVVQMDGMGTNWRSKSFHDVCFQNLDDGGFPDRIAWIKAAAKDIPQMDLTRVGIFGGSAGGQNALAALLHHGDFYKVAVADCGCHDNRMDKIWWNEQWMGWPIGKEYADVSNVTHAGKLRGKLLLIVGELDTNVDPASTMQVVNALVKADRDFDLLIIPGAGHGAAETPYGSRRRADFLVRHLHGVEPRWSK